MHKWLEHLTHTNIHISPEEEIPQGWDRAICVRKTEHSIQTETDHITGIASKPQNVLQLPQGWQHLAKETDSQWEVIMFLMMWWTLVFLPSLQAGEMSCTHKGLWNVMLVGWTGRRHSTRKVSRKDKTRGLKPSLVVHQPQPVVIIGNIVFIHESNKAESVLKAFTARIRAHE